MTNSKIQRNSHRRFLTQFDVSATVARLLSNAYKGGATLRSRTGIWPTPIPRGSLFAVAGLDQAKCQIGSIHLTLSLVPNPGILPSFPAYPEDC